MKYYLSIIIFSIVLLLTQNKSIFAQQLPQIGAEVYIEPGQSKEQIEQWMKILGDNHLPVARIFMMWNYLETKPEVWDFSLWDAAFDGAAKHGVKITATLVPNSPPFFWGKEYFYRVHVGNMFETENKREKSKEYIKQVVERYKSHPALDSWWLFNEPGQYPSPDSLAVNNFRQFLQQKYISVDTLNKKWLTAYNNFSEVTYDEAWNNANWVWPQSYLDWNRFWRKHINDHISWLAQEVRSHDAQHPLHSNPKNLINFLAHYDLNGLQENLDVMGASMHPSWDFSKLPRDRYGMGIAWNNELIKGIAGKIPYWVSELQGGNNIYSGFRPLCPSKDDISQWVWTSIASGAKRVIFWSLNSRIQGSESVEWNMIDYQGNPTERLTEAIDIAKTINRNSKIFETAKPISSPITVLVSPESMLIQERKQNNHSGLEGYKEGLHIKSVLACYMSLLQHGLSVDIQLISNYQWQQTTANRTIILADAMSISQLDANQLTEFIFNGGKLITLGLTGLFDENEKAWIGGNSSFPFERAFGAEIKDIQLIDPLFSTSIANNALPTHLWRTLIAPTSGRVTDRYGKEAIAMQNNYGKGSSVWLPSAVAIGAWLNDMTPLGNFLLEQTKSAVADAQFRFDRYHKNCWMKVLSTIGGYITVLSNANNKIETINIISPGKLTAKVLFGEGWDPAAKKAILGAGKTLVMEWK